TDSGGMNQALWEAAGYKIPPTIEQMVRELARFEYRFKRGDDK
ncbi:unnamed protein product, partial [marine sediment metagenome]